MGSTSSPIGKRNHSKLHELILNCNRNSLSFKFEISSSISSAKRSKISKKWSQNHPKSKQNQAQVAPKSLQVKSSKIPFKDLTKKSSQSAPRATRKAQRASQTLSKLAKNCSTNKIKNNMISTIRFSMMFSNFPAQNPSILASILEPLASFCWKCKFWKNLDFPEANNDFQGFEL